MGDVDSDGATGARGLVDPRLRESMAVDHHLFLPRKGQSKGVKGACPLGLPPPLGERGGHPHNYHRGFPDALIRGFPMKIKHIYLIPGSKVLSIIFIVRVRTSGSCTFLQSGLFQYYQVNSAGTIVKTVGFHAIPI